MLSHVQRIARLGLLVLLGMALLYQPDPYRPLAHAQETPPAQTFVAYLPFVSTVAAAPDLRFTPDSIELAPGAETNITVTVDPIADLTGATFDLTGVQDGVVSSFQAAPDGLSGTLTIIASEALEAAERPLEVHGQSGIDSSKKWVGKLAVKTTTTASAVTRFVDAVNGKDTNSGVGASPFKTLKKALSVAKSGDTINLAPGSYTKNGSGDIFPLMVPAGVTIVGTLGSNGGKLVFLSPESSAAGTDGLIFAGDATVKDLELDVFGTALLASTGKVALNNINLILNRISLELKGTAQGTLTKSLLFISPSLIVGGVVVAEKAQFTMDGGLIEGSSRDCASGAESILVRDSAQATLKGSPRFKEAPGHILTLKQSAKATANFVFATTTLQAGCKPTPMFEAIDSAQLTLNDSTISATGTEPGVAISYNSSAPLTVSRTAMGGFKGAGISLGNQVKAANIEQSGISTSGIAIDAEKSINAKVLITNTQLDRNEIGAVGLQITMRRSKATNGSIGVMILGNGADLGTVADPGGNTFNGNKLFGVQFNQRFAESSPLLPAVGNSWNASIQGADANGKYSPGTEVNWIDKDIFGKNFSLVIKAGSQAPLKIVL